MTTMTEPTEHTAEQALDARLRLDVAIAQLLTPTFVELDRYAPTDPEVAAITAQDDADHRAEMTRLRDRYAAAAARGDDDHQARVIRAAAAKDAEHRRRRNAADRETATIPSLLDQLADAVESSTGTGRSVGTSRSAIGLAAAELLGHIEHTVGHRGQPTLAARIRSWADHLAEHADPTDLAQYATTAERWVAEARAIVQPDRGFEIRGACPICHTRRVWVQEGDERVLRSALQVSYATRSARCIAPGCTGHWARDYLEHLTRLVVQDRDEKDHGDGRL